MKRVVVRGIFFFLLCASVRGQANLSFSGGSGSPLSMTLSQSVNYVMTSTIFTTPTFLFDEVGNVFGDNIHNVTGNITFSINGGAPQSFSGMNSGITFQSSTANDLYIFDSVASFTIGDIVTLNAGTLTTTTSVTGAAPAAGSFTTWVTDDLAGQISSNGVAVPEPSIGALLALAGVTCALIRLRPRRS
jgi:hypothetical protein